MQMAYQILIKSHLKKQKDNIQVRKHIPNQSLPPVPTNRDLLIEIRTTKFSANCSSKFGHGSARPCSRLHDRGVVCFTVHLWVHLMALLHVLPSRRPIRWIVCAFAQPSVLLLVRTLDPTLPRPPVHASDRLSTRIFSPSMLAENVRKI